jgi:hypothetical protein
VRSGVPAGRSSSETTSSASSGNHALGELHELVLDRPVVQAGGDGAEHPAATAAHRDAERREVDVHLQRGAAQDG